MSAISRGLLISRARSRAGVRFLTPSQVLEQELDRLVRVDPRELLHEVGVLGREELALGPLASFVAVGEEQGGPARLAFQQEVRVGRFDAGQVIEVVRLPEACVAGRAGSALEEGQTVL